jgi:hypothetical protein
MNVAESLHIKGQDKGLDDMNDDQSTTGWKLLCETYSADHIMHQHLYLANIRSRDVTYDEMWRLHQIDVQAIKNIVPATKDEMQQFQVKPGQVFQVHEIASR